MTITLNILIDFLDYELERDNVAGNPAFRGLELLDPNDPACDEGILYIGLLSEALKYRRGEKKLIFLCVRDRMVDAMETTEAMDGIIVVKKNLRLYELFNVVQRIFSRVQQWQYSLQTSISNNQGVQDLLDLSEDMLGNHIDVLDSTFKLLAYTKNIVTDDPVTNDLIHFGYHPRKTLDRLQKYRRFEQYETENDVIVSTDYVMSDYVTVKKVFRRRGNYFLIVVMVCCTKFTDGVLDLFRMLIDSLQYYTVEKRFADSESPLSNFADDIFSGKVSAVSEIQDRAATIGVSFRGDYNLFLLRFSDTGNFPFGLIVMQLSLALRYANVFQYKHSIIVLNQNMRYDNSRESSREKLSLISGALDGTASCVGGVSNSFKDLSEMPMAYNQAVAAMHFGEHLHGYGEPVVSPELTAYFFEDYALYYECYAARQYSPSLTANSMSARVVGILREHEQRYHVHYLEILHTYLLCGCRATLAAEKLNMHRNTVLYHINRMEELLNISLEDPEIRLKIMTGYKRYELEAFSMPPDEFCAGSINR